MTRLAGPIHDTLLGLLPLVCLVIAPAGFAASDIPVRPPQPDVADCDFRPLGTRQIPLSFETPSIGYNEIYFEGMSILQGKGVSPTDRDDIMQEVFIAMLRPNGAFRGESKFSTWLYRVVSNAAISHYRKNGKYDRLARFATNDDEEAEGGLLPPPKTTATPDKIAANNEEASKAAAKIVDALGNLAPEYRMTYLLYSSGMKYDEIAERLDVPVGTIKSRINRASSEIGRRLTGEADSAVGARVAEAEGWKPEAFPRDSKPTTPHQAIGHLPEQQRLLLTWYGQFNLPLEDIAKMSGMAIKQVASEISLGKQELKKIAEANGIELPSWLKMTREDALAHLTEMERKVALGRLVAKKTNQQVAQDLGINNATAATHFSAAKRHLAEILGEHQLESGDWQIAPVRHETLEQVVASARQEGQAKHIFDAVILKGRSEQEVAAELGISLGELSRALLTSGQPIADKMRRLGISDPRMNRWSGVGVAPKTLEEAIASLPERIRGIAEQRYLHGETDSKKIGEALNLPAADVKMRFQDTNNRLGRILEESRLTDPRSANLYAAKPTTVIQAIWQVHPSHQKVLRMRYLQDMEYADLRTLPENKDNRNFLRAVMAAEDALTEVLKANQITDPVTLHLHGVPRTPEEVIRKVEDRELRTILRMSIVEKLTDAQIYERMNLRPGRLTNMKKQAEAAFKAVALQHNLPYQASIPEGDTPGQLLQSPVLEQQ